jgi:hypothetical protein
VTSPMLDCRLRPHRPVDGASRQTSLEAARKGGDPWLVFLSLEGMRWLGGVRLAEPSLPPRNSSVPSCRHDQPFGSVPETAGSRPVVRVQLGFTRGRGDARVVSFPES